MWRDACSERLNKPRLSPLPLGCLLYTLYALVDTCETAKLELKPLCPILGYPFAIAPMHAPDPQNRFDDVLKKKNYLPVRAHVTLVEFRSAFSPGSLRFMPPDVRNALCSCSLQKYEVQNT